MKSLIKWTGLARAKNVSRAIFLLAPLALLVYSGTAAAVSPVSVPGAGTLGNQLRQEAVLAPKVPVNAPLVLPEGGPARR